MSGTLGFKYFPSQQWRPSGVNVEFDASQANTATQNQRALLIGQILAAGTATPDVPVMGYSQSQVNLLCGATSMLALMYAAYRKQDPFGEVWLGPLSDDSAGVVPNGTITLTGTATAAGTIPLYIMGVSIPVPIALGDTAAVAGPKVAAQIALAVGICCTAVATDAVLAVTANHKGLALNDIDLRCAYIGAQNGEVMPAGLTIAFSNPVTGACGSPLPGTLSSGATNPLLTNLLANIGVQLFDFIALPYTDATTLAAMKAFLGDQAGRWSAEQMQYGHSFGAYRGTVSARGSFGTGLNDQHSSILGFFDSPTPAWLEAADWCAVHAVRIKVNPAQGLATQALGLLAPPLPSQDTPGERNTLLFDGVSTFTVSNDGTCRIDRTITTYQQNPSGQPDDSYLNTNIMFQAMYAARYIAAQITSQFIAPGKILVSNGTPIGPGSPATTPALMLGSVIAIYAYLCSIFIAQNPLTFAANCTAQPGTKGQVLMYLPIDFSDQVINVGILVQFRQST